MYVLLPMHDRLAYNYVRAASAPFFSFLFFFFTKGHERGRIIRSEFANTIRRIYVRQTSPYRQRWCVIRLLLLLLLLFDAPLRIRVHSCASMQIVFESDAGTQRVRFVTVSLFIIVDAFFIPPPFFSSSITAIESRFGNLHREGPLRLSA